MGLSHLVEMHHKALGEAHARYKPGSLDLVWNDAQWDPSFIRDWWPLLRKDGGVLLLHNVIGNGEVSRWCMASPKRVLKEVFPDEEFEFLTLLEPHKAHQGSVAMLRRLDPERRPKRWRYLWGGKSPEDVEGTFTSWEEAVEREF